MKYFSSKSWALLCLSLTFCLSTPQVLGDIAGVKLGFAIWSHQPGGTVNYQSGDVDTETGFNLTKETDGFVWLAIEHPAPGLPNIRITHTKLGHTGNGPSTFSFGGFNFTGNVNTTLNLDQTDLTLYYELADTGVHLDLGITLKYIDGTAKAVDATNTSTVDFKGVLPLVYASLDFKMPLTGMSFGVSGNGISYDGHSYTDYQVKFAYKSKAKLGVELGYRRMQLTLNNLDGVTSDMKFDGPYAALYFNF